MGLCHRDMARSQVGDGGTASSMEDCFEYIDYEVADSRKWEVFQLGFGRGANKSSP